MEKDEIIDLLKTIYDSKDRDIDGKILSVALDMVWECGIKEKEIPYLKIKDTIDPAGKVADTLKIGRDSVPLPSEIQVILTNYLKYLKENDKYSTPDDKLFPGYNIIRTLERHVGKFYSGGKIFHKLRNAGIKNCYHALLDSGVRQEECLKGTAAQFRITEGQVTRVLGGTIQPEVKRVIGATIQPAEKCKGEVNKEIIGLFDKLIMTDPLKTAVISKLQKELFEVLDQSKFHSDEERETIKKLFEEKIKGKLSTPAPPV